MTEIQLQTAIKKVIEKEIIPELPAFKQGKMKVFLQSIPWTPAFERSNEVIYDDARHDDYGIDKYLPCCEVKLLGGETKPDVEGQTVTVGITVNVKDTSDDISNMSGYQDVMIVIDRIRNYFTANMGIRTNYRMDTQDIEWGIDETVSPPYYVGAIITKWRLSTPPYNDVERFL